jgi:hypothetical protein
LAKSYESWVKKEKSGIWTGVGTNDHDSQQNTEKVPNRRHSKENEAPKTTQAWERKQMGRGMIGKIDEKEQLTTVQ